MNTTSWFVACLVLSTAIGSASAAARVTAGDRIRAHARAHMDRNEAEGAALDLATLGRTSEPATDEDRVLAGWLARQARERKTAALEARKRGETVRATELYAAAVQIDPTLLGEDDHGLEAGCAAKLTGYALGFHHYNRSSYDAAEQAFRAELVREKDDYRRWRAQIWLADIAALKAVVTTRDARDQAARDRRAAEESARAEAALAEIAERNARAMRQAAEERVAAATEPTTAQKDEPRNEPEPPARSRERRPASSAVGMDGTPLDGVVVTDHWGKEIMVGADGQAHGVVRDKVIVGFDGKPIGVAVPPRKR